ncbi:hypothetical protein LTR66_004875 [Elasticomyces elasticus]|nr:hypothetical protein LTR66_004875 [Elasticomyces elasticus]
MSLWQSYKHLAPRTRLAIGAGIMTYASVALFLSNQAEKTFHLMPTEQDKEKLRSLLPKVSIVDKDE